MEDNTKRAKQLFERWKANLAKKAASERETAKAQANFEELFYEFSVNQVDFESAEGLLPSIVAAHMPSHIVVERVWTMQKTHYQGVSKKEWLDDWRLKIEESAKAAFYSWYKIPGEEEPNHGDTGGMSPKEHALQRKYADSFPTITATELEALEVKRRKFLEESLDDLTFVV